VIILVSTCAVGPHARAVMICALHLCNTLCSIPHLTWQSTQRIHRNTHIRPSSPFRRGTTLGRLHSAAVQHLVVSIPPRYNTCAHCHCFRIIARFTHFDGKNVEDFLASKGELVKRSKGGVETLEFFEPPTTTAALEGGKEDSSEQRILSLSEKKK
jgi:hypothetical protein